jgi:ribosome-associated toxin RatA of RatAB toxin-antitoxin module
VPTVTNSIQIDAPVERVFAIAKDVERFPEFMPEVQRITVLETNEDRSRQVVEWVGLIPAIRMTVKWTEEDIWDDVERTCTFTQVKGDFTAYGGQWRFVPEGDGCRFESRVDYELEIPTVGALIRGVVKKIMQGNVDQLLAQIKKRAEAVSSRVITTEVTEDTEKARKDE